MSAKCVRDYLQHEVADYDDFLNIENYLNKSTLLTIKIYWQIQWSLLPKSIKIKACLNKTL